MKAPADYPIVVLIVAAWPGATLPAEQLLLQPPPMQNPFPAGG
ncbi:MAG TPA: hypothetical protein VK689_05220 [Armatimonadota bacterium]|nr:hypothetical protein [Armatimonadota bacterium]